VSIRQRSPRPARDSPGRRRDRRRRFRFRQARDGTYEKVPSTASS
jgi:hypothetical protein